MRAISTHSRRIPARLSATAICPNSEDPAPRRDCPRVRFANIDVGLERAASSYCASVQVSDPVSLKDTFEKKIRHGLPSAIPRWSVETSRGPAFL